MGLFKDIYNTYFLQLKGAKIKSKLLTHYLSELIIYHCKKEHQKDLIQVNISSFLLCDFVLASRFR